MEYLVWYYTEGFKYYLNRWIFTIKYINHFFSLPLLIQTLFSPWKRLSVEDNKPGFNLGNYFENLTFNLISRGIGAIVRLALFWVGAIIISFVLIGGALGIIIWLLFPPFGFQIYSKHKNRTENYITSIISRAKESDNVLNSLFDTDVGKFMAGHLGVDLKVLIESPNNSNDFLHLHFPKSMKALVNIMLEEDVWPENYLRKYGLVKNDILLSAAWWDQIKSQDAEAEDKDGFGRPGVAMDLLFGYIPTLSQYSLDLSAPRSFSHRLIGREDIVERMDRVLEGGRSVILVGQPGVGKKTVVLEFAQRAITGQLGPELEYRRILEFDYNFLLSEAYDLNTKKTKLAQIFREAASAGNIILALRDIHRLINPEVEGYDFTDVFEEFLDKRKLKMIAISTPVDYERFVAPNLRIRKYLERVDVNPTSKEVALDILLEAAIRWERTNRIVVAVPTLRRILDGSDKYITETPFPEKALELMDAVINYRSQKGGYVATVDDANAVLAEKTGISFTSLTQVDKVKLGKLEDLIHERLVNQETAVSMIARSLRGRTLGVTKENRPIGAFMFLGPTGVGKTETAKVLAKVYYGSEDEILRFDMAEYGGIEGLERLIGSVIKNRPGTLTTAIKNKPASLLLLDEFEKARPEIYNLFLTLVDEGYLTDAFGRTIIGRHLFIIATSNAGAEYVRELVSEGITGENLQKKVVNYVMQRGIFTPEFLNRFDGVIVYEPLKHIDLVRVAKHLLTEMSENLKKNDVYLEVTDDAAEKIATDGYEPEFGARPMRRIIDLIVADVLGKSILNGEIKAGDKIRIVPGSGYREYTWQTVS